MTQEEKQLLLRDICARLPYGVKVQYTAGDGITTITCWIDEISVTSQSVKIAEQGKTNSAWRLIENIKPYLRPMSSLSNLERSQLEFAQDLDMRDATEISISHVLEFFLEHHLDYNNLILKGLALEAPEGMYDTKQ